MGKPAVRTGSEPGGRNLVLDVRNLSITHVDCGRLRPIIRDLSFHVPEGSYAYLVGRSGIGKSLTTRAILGLLSPEEWIVDGTIRINCHQGQRMETILEQRRFQETALSTIRGKYLNAIFQEPVSHLHPSLTIGRQFREAMAGMEPHGGPAFGIQTLLDMVKIDPFKAMTGYAHEFSQGECQRILLAMALVGKNLLIADEPTSSINPELRKGIIEIFSSLRKKQMIRSMVIVTHQKDVVDALVRPGDLFIGLHQGQDGIIAEQTVWTRKHIREKHLVHPCFTFAPREPAIPEPPAESPDMGMEPPAKPEEPSLTPLPLLQVRNLCQSFRRGLFSSPETVVEKVDFTLDQGEMVGIIGPSGSGKSTIAKAAVRLLDRTRGEVVLNINGQVKDLVRLQPHGARQDTREMIQVRKQVQYISQEAAMVFNPAVRVKEILTETLNLLPPLDEKGKQDLIYTSLSEMGFVSDRQQVPGFVSKYPRELSGGEKQRLNLLRCFLLQPRLIIADEPFANQDMQTVSELVAIMKTCQHRNQTAFLLISHDIPLVETICDRIYYLADKTLHLKPSTQKKG